MEHITEETMEYVGILAKLKLSEQEKKKAAKDMETMLGYVEMLNELDTDGVEPMTHLFEQANRFREDQVTEGASREEMLSNAPAQAKGCYQVPRTVE